MRFLPIGDTGLLVEVSGLPDVLILHAALDADRRRGRAPWVEDLVPAERTVLIRFDPRSVECDAVAAWVHRAMSTAARARRAMSTAAPAGRPSGADVAGADPAGHDPPGPDVAGPDVAVRVIVRYDGDDLDDVGRLTGLGPAGVVAVHTGTVWTVAFTGFAPGFGYLVGGDPRLRVPRLPVPRVRVPAGAVALGGDYSGVYPRASPGGWRLIGRTDSPIWDLRRDPPALLRPGVRVQFVDAGRLVANPESAAGLEPAAAFHGRELPSEGLVPGALQVPPGGRPVLFGVDHPVTGGYPMVAVVLSADVDLAGQLRPGQRLRLRRMHRKAPAADHRTVWWGW